jgi:hypothetical protein
MENMRILWIRIRLRIPNTAYGTSGSKDEGEGPEEGGIDGRGGGERRRKNAHTVVGGGGGVQKTAPVPNPCTNQSGPAREDCVVARKDRHESFSPLNTFMRKGKDPDPYL